MKGFFEKLCPLVHLGPPAFMNSSPEWHKVEEREGFKPPHDYVAMISDERCPRTLRVDLPMPGTDPDPNVYLYSPEKARQVESKDYMLGMEERIPHSLLIGHTHDSRLVIAGLARPKGIYRVQFRARGGLSKAAFVAPDVTTLLRNRASLERMLFPVLREADAAARLLQIEVEDSHVRVETWRLMQKGRWPWLLAWWMEEAMKDALWREDPLMEKPNWPELLADRILAAHLGVEAQFNTDGAGAGSHVQLPVSLPLMPRLHSCFRVKERPPSTLDVEEVLVSLRKAEGAVPADYLDLMAEYGGLYLEVDLQIEGHEGKKRRLSIWEPRYCGVVPASFKGDESGMLPPYMMVGGDGYWHQLAYSRSMNPPGYYRLSEYRACFGEPAPVFISSSLEGILVRGEGLNAFFEPRRLEDKATARLRCLSADIRARLLPQRPESVDEKSWSYGPHKCEPAIEDLISTYLNVEAYEPESLARWCQQSEARNAQVQEFKIVLKAALDEPGLVTPWMYDAWTCGDEGNETQENMQVFLQELWNLCFPAEPRHDAPRRAIWTDPLWWSTEAGHKQNQEGWERMSELKAKVGTELKLENHYIITHRFTQMLKEAESVNDPLLEEIDWQVKLLERTLAKFFPSWKGAESSPAASTSPTCLQ